MPIVEVTDEAEEDIVRLWQRIGLDNPERADSYIDEINATFQLRATMPLSAVARPELRENLRSYPFDNYVVYYEPIIDGILIVRVLHAARDVDDMFNVQ